MSNADRQIRDRLKKIREDARVQRESRAQAVRERDEAKQKFADAEHDGKVTDWPEFQVAEQSVRNLGEIDDKISDLKVAEQSILQLLGDDVQPPSSSDVAGNGHGQLRGWDARRIMGEDSNYSRLKSEGAFHSDAKFGTILMGQIATREEAVSFLRGIGAELPGAPAGPMTSPGAAGLIQPDVRGMVAPILRPLRLLDLIPTGTTDSNSIEYVQVTAIPNTTAPVAEGTPKPETGLTLTDATAAVRTIAGWIKVNRQAMDDAAGLATLINTLLPHDVRRKIEAQVLNGDGTGQNLKGILRQTGVGAPAFVAGDNIADAILRAMTVVVLSEGDPNFTAANPLDWQDLLMMRENPDRSGTYLYGGPGMMAASTVWGMVITPSTAIAQGAPLVGDSTGVTLLVREGVNVKTSDSDQDDFIRNRVTVLAEARVALPVWRPSNFAVADTTAA